MKTSTVAYPTDLLEHLRKTNSAEIDEIQILNKKIGSLFCSTGESIYFSNMDF